MRMYRSATPHPGYRTLLERLLKARKKDYFVYTSNVDGLFAKVRRVRLISLGPFLSPRDPARHHPRTPAPSNTIGQYCQVHVLAGCRSSAGRMPAI